MIRSENKRVRFLTAIIAATMLFAGLSLTGCSTTGIEKVPPGGVEQPKQSKEAPQTQDKTSNIVETTLVLVDQGKVLRLDFSLKNISDKELSLLFGSGHQYDIFITDVAGQEVYNWAADKSFTQALIEKNLPQGQELSFTEEWDYTDDNGERLSPGKYSVKVAITANVENEQVKADELSATKEIEIKK